MSNGNREYKSDVFSMLMQDKANALSVYNALNGTNYTNPDELEICTLDKGVSLSIRNDAAFIVDAALSIYEHQSTVCPNMPVRNLVYYTTTIMSIIKERNISCFVTFSMKTYLNTVLLTGNIRQLYAQKFLYTCTGFVQHDHNEPVTPPQLSGCIRNFK